MLIEENIVDNNNVKLSVFLNKVLHLDPKTNLDIATAFFNVGGFSQPRNPVITKIFRFVKFSENIGSGFDKMFRGWKSQYGSTPIVEGDFDWHKITFPFNHSFDKTTNKEERIPEMLELLRNNSPLSILEIAEKLQITPFKVQYSLNKLKEQGRIKRVGSKKAGEWVVVK